MQAILSIGALVTDDNTAFFLACLVFCCNAATENHHANYKKAGEITGKIPSCADLDASIKQEHSLLVSYVAHAKDSGSIGSALAGINHCSLSVKKRRHKVKPLDVRRKFNL